MSDQDIAISVENVSKEFRLGKQPSYGRFSEVMQRWLTSPFSGRNENDQKKFLALDDVSFQVKKGDILGIVGRNGAGKSTLLKILSRITPPSSGRFGIRGRVGSLLEVGTGFHPELTGRENVFLNGTIIGMKRNEIARYFDEIVAFAEIEKFIDTPVKHYSSGMYMRLAFSVAAHLDPEILIVDEVLAVGDALFQKKCLDKIKAIGESGKTIIFVSHQLNVVRNLCQSGVWLDHGKCLASGSAIDVVNKFQQSWDSGVRTLWSGSLFSVDYLVELIEVEVNCNHVPQASAQMMVETGMLLNIKFRVHQAGHYLPSFLVYTSEDQILFSGSPVLGTDDEINTIFEQELKSGYYESRCVIPGNIMQPGKYSVTVNFNHIDGRLLMNQKNLLTFTMEDDGVRKRGFLGTWLGAIRPSMKWETTHSQQH